MSESTTPTPAGGGLNIAIVGATGSVGQDLVRALDKEPFPIAGVRLLASRSTRTPALEVKGERTKVHTLPATPAESALFEDVDLVFFATPPDITAQYAPALASAGLAVIDIGAALADRAPVLVPAAGSGDLDRFVQARVACSPSAPAVLLSTVLAPLLDLGLSACRSTFLMSAGLVGREGTEELSAQVVALFNSQEPPRTVFPSGLAFDLVSDVGETDPVTGWTAVERRVVEEVSSVTRLPAERFALTALLAPLFTGMGAAVHVDFASEVLVDEVRAALEGGLRLRLTTTVPGPRRLAGKAAFYVGRLRDDPLGDGVHLWAAADNLRAGATANAIEIALLLYREGLL